MLFLRPALRNFLLGLLLLGGGLARAQAPTRYPVPDHERPVSLLTSRRATYLVTQGGVFELAHRRFVRRYQSPAPIQCALAADTVLWLGTVRGAICLNISDGQFRPRPFALPLPAAEASVSTLCQDAAGGVWLGVAGQGAFRFAHGALSQELRIPSLNASQATADSSVWMGTNLGLYRWHGQQWTRYNEEGVANLEIPDNIVEKLLPDHAGNLWVLMSAGISVFPVGGHAAGGGEHVPTVTFIGQPGNEIYSLAYLPGVGHLFATALGLLLLPPEPAGALVGFEPATDQITPRQLLVPLAGGSLPARPGLVQLDQRQRLWLASPGEVRVWTARAFRRFIQPQVAGQALVRQ